MKKRKGKKEFTRNLSHENRGTGAVFQNTIPVPRGAITRPHDTHFLK